MREYVEGTWHSWDDAIQGARFEDPEEVAKLSILLVERRKAGLLHVVRNATDMYLANIQIHPEFQNRGLGSLVVRGVMDEARGRGQPLRLQVLKVNAAARRLYERLGFRAFDETPTHVLMIWRPN